MEGHQVHTLCRPTANISSLKRDNIRILWGDVLDRSSVERAMKGCRRVYHLAAYARNWARDKTLFYDVNVGGLRNVLSAAVKMSVERVVFASSSLTLGPSNGSEVTEAAPSTGEYFTHYVHSKVLAEREVTSYRNEILEVVTVNPTRVFGPGLLTESNSVTRLIQWYVRGWWRLILGDGQATGNYVYAPDVIRGHIQAMETGQPGERYILGGSNVTLKTCSLFWALFPVNGKSLYPFLGTLPSGWPEQKRSEPDGWGATR